MRRTITRTGLARRQRHQRYSTRFWVDRLVDIPAFIIGNAPSLNECNLSLLEHYFTIGINRAFYKIDPTILIWQDISLWNTEYQKLHSTQAVKVSRDVSDPRKIYYNFYLKGGPYKFDRTSTHVLYGRGSTGPLAVQLAVAMGCSPIILLGMDCLKDAQNQSDFYGNNQHWTDTTQENCLLGLKFIHEQCPVPIRSCNNSSLWPKEQLENIIGTINSIHKRSRQSYVSQLLNIKQL